jgi:hypothetical protein
MRVTRRRRLLAGGAGRRWCGLGLAVLAVAPRPTWAFLVAVGPTGAADHGFSVRRRRRRVKPVAENPLRVVGQDLHPPEKRALQRAILRKTAIIGGESWRQSAHCPAGLEPRSHRAAPRRDSPSQVLTATASEDLRTRPRALERPHRYTVIMVAVGAGRRGGRARSARHTPTRSRAGCKRSTVSREINSRLVTNWERSHEGIDSDSAWVEPAWERSRTVADVTGDAATTVQEPHAGSV